MVCGEGVPVSRALVRPFRGVGRRVTLTQSRRDPVPDILRTVRRVVPRGEMEHERVFPEL